MAWQEWNATLRRCIYWFFGDNDGNIVIFQFPNPPLFVALGAYVVRMFSSTWLFWVAEAIFLIAICSWAMLEIVRGVNWFRRLLGATVLVLVLLPRLLAVIK